MRRRPGIFAVAALLPLFAGCAQLRCALQSDREYANGLVIRQDRLTENDYNRQYKFGNPMPDVRFITIHNTWNFGPAQNERDYLDRRRDRQYLSFHFAVDETEAIQILPLDVNGWHAGDGSAGDGNRRSIGIEICRSRCVGDDEILYRRAEANGVRLAALLLHRYRLPAEALRKHQDWNGKNCPHRILDEHRWEEFRAAVAASLAELNRNE